MKTIFHPANERGHANHGWLDSYHSFSFSSYYDPEKMNFGMLRVLNDDTVAEGMGFGRHPHDNMEIVSIPLEGALKHSDSTGRSEIIKKGEVQIMSAGTGLQHSEMNASASEPVKFLQIWVFPKEQNIKPAYDQKAFDRDARQGQFVTVVSPEEKSNAVRIHQDAWFSLGSFDNAATAKYALHKEGNGVYIFVLEGSVKVAGKQLNRRDGLGVSETSEVELEIEAGSEVLLIEVPMQ